MTLPIAAGLLGESHPGVVVDLLQEVAVLLNLLQTPARSKLGESLSSNPVQVTANLPCYKLQHTLGEAVGLSLLTRSDGRVENSPLYQLKVSIQPGFCLQINALSLTQSGHVQPGPELASLVQVDRIAIGEVLRVESEN